MDRAGRLAARLSHAGHGYHAASDAELRSVAASEAETLASLRDRATMAGIADLAHGEISVGATPTLRFSAGLPGITELRPGNYVYFDRTQVALGAATLDDCALTVLATVVSKPAADRIVLDCGSKTLTSDQARGITKAAGHGAILANDSAAPRRVDDAFRRHDREGHQDEGTHALEPRRPAEEQPPYGDDQPADDGAEHRVQRGLGIGDGEADPQPLQRHRDHAGPQAERLLRTR